MKIYDPRSGSGLGTGPNIERMRNVTPGAESEPKPDVLCMDGVAGCPWRNDPHKHVPKGVISPWPPHHKGADKGAAPLRMGSDERE